MEEHVVLYEGDTVRLTIGGPLMTVLAVDGERCCCFWFDDQGRLAHGDFERELIEFVAPAIRLIPHTEAFWRRSRAHRLRPFGRSASTPRAQALA